MKKLLLFGAGKIGRSFIAPIFEKSGYKIVFVDIDLKIVDLINSRRTYDIHILDSNHPEKEKSLSVKNISAIHLLETNKINRQIESADIIVTSVGKRGLLSLTDLISKGLKIRFEMNSRIPVDIIFAENIQNAAELFHKTLKKYLPQETICKNVGLVETSIGKMVPIMTEDQLKKDPMAIYAEPYDNLIVDELGFINGVPKVKGLSPKKNIKAWVDRKLFIHNLGHAVLVYQANFADSSTKHTWEALQDKHIKTITRNAMLQSADILMGIYHDELLKKDLINHIDNLLDRFSNQALGDTIFRVGCDLSRKLNIDDRLMIPILTGLKMKKDYSLILESWVKGCFFNAKDGNGNVFSEDQKFKIKYKQNPIDILRMHCNLDERKYASIYDVVNQTRKKITNASH